MEHRKSSEIINRDNRTLSGYAVLFNTRSKTIYERGRKFTEIIKRGAFDVNPSADHDVKLYFNHDTSMPLARQNGGSLRLFEDEKGIRFEADIPDTTLGNDIRELMNKGVLTGEMSFGFSTSKESWDEGGNLRNVEKGKIYEISVVVDAAYPQTHSQLRNVMSDINNKRIKLLRRRFK
jgi:HK97 family phage prohead protease